MTGKIHRKYSLKQSGNKSKQGTMSFQSTEKVFLKSSVFCQYLTSLSCFGCLFLRRRKLPVSNPYCLWRMFGWHIVDGNAVGLNWLWAIHDCMYSGCLVIVALFFSCLVAVTDLYVILIKKDNENKWTVHPIVFQLFYQNDIYFLGLLSKMIGNIFCINSSIFKFAQFLNYYFPTMLAKGSRWDIFPSKSATKQLNSIVSNIKYSVILFFPCIAWVHLNIAEDCHIHFRWGKKEK